MINKIGIHIKVKDFQKSLDFYNSLGFTKVFEYGPDKQITEDYNGTVFEHNNCAVEIADGHRAVKEEVFQQPIESSKISLMITVDDLGEIINRCEQNNIEITVGPRHFYWGTIELVIKDPDGTVLVFIQRYTPEAAEKLKVDKNFSVKP